MTRSSKQRIRGHAVGAMACLCLSLTAQIALVGSLSLLSEAPGFRSVPVGTLTDGQGHDDSSPWHWVYSIAMVSATESAKGRSAVLLEGPWGRWAVIRAVRKLPVNWHGMQTVPVQPSWIPGWATDRSAEPPTAQDADRNRTISDLAFGWPYPALSLTSEVRWSPVEINVRDAIEVNSLSDAERRARFTAGKGFGPLGSFPTRVIWPGMLINILIGACVWAAPFALLAAARALRGRHRLKRGLCASCGYGPWTGGGACPECGSRFSGASLPAASTGTAMRASPP